LGEGPKSRRAGSDPHHGFVMAARSKPGARSAPQVIGDDLRIPERLMLFCLASGTEWERAGVTHATAQQMLVRGLIDREGAAGRFRLTPLGRSVFAAQATGRRAGWLRTVRWRTS